MKIGGGERESVMVLLPIAALTILTTIVLGGPEEALNAAERLLYDAWAAAMSFF